MKNTFFLLLAVFAFGSAHAAPAQPDPVEESSPALQLARRVASMENSKDLPSRAFWLSRIAARNTRVAMQTHPAPKTKKKPVQN
jgi:hypothetical protein